MLKYQSKESAIIEQAYCKKNSKYVNALLHNSLLLTWLAFKFEKSSIMLFK